MDNAFSVENVITNWNEIFPNCTLTVVDLKKPHAVMGALFQLFDGLGIDQDAILSPPPKESQSENLIFYLDLVPVINTTRVVNYLISQNGGTLHQSTINVTNLLQPTTITTSSILLLLYNYVLFKNLRMSEIEPYEQELSSKTDQVAEMKERCNKLLELLNEQAIEKAERSGRLKKIDHEIKQFEEEQKQEKEALDNVKQDIEAELKENRPLEMLLEQKKAQRDAQVSIVEKQRAMRVYDADDIRAHYEKATQKVKDAEEELNTRRAKLMQKDNSLKYLQPTTSSLDIANNWLDDIAKLSVGLRDCENVDLESMKGEQEELNGELAELEGQLAELSTARAEAAKKRQENSAKRQHERPLAINNLKEAEEKHLKCENINKQATQRIVQLKELLIKYEKDKIAGMDALSNIEEDFATQLKLIDDVLLEKVQESKDKIEIKLRKRD